MVRSCSRYAVIVLGVAFLSVAVLGCSGRNEPVDVQVAARVNKDEITIHQVQLLLQRQPRLAANFPEQAARNVLDSLIEQELAAQAARAQGLDQDPGVVQAMQAARREVLARAFQDRLAGKATGPSSDEVDRYYEAHPALFAQRRIYTLQEFLVETAGADQLSRVQAITNDARGVAEVEDRLRQTGLRYRTRQFAQASEDMPMGMVESMSKLGPGRSLLVPQGEAARIFSVLHVQAAPLDRRMANEAIAAYLFAERKRIAVGEGMKIVREAAQIEYVGKFANAASAPAVAASAAGR
jgi:EpsD family peptidyl-prolyl cis-trans isomerase